MGRGGGETERIDERVGNCKRVMRNTLFCSPLPFLFFFFKSFSVKSRDSVPHIVCPPPQLPSPKLSAAKFDLCLYYFVQRCRKLSTSGSSV